ncbi:MAG: hypothetical protein ACKVPX_10475 [Myxococcaceae bacterium]
MRWLKGAALVFGLAACGDPEAAFREGRARESCTQSWPVCNLVAGCLMANENYVEGRFPGQNRFIVQLQEPSLVEVSFYLKDIGAAGALSVITFYEDGCRDRTRQEIEGRTFINEMERLGVVTREQELSGIGDHRIEVESDSQARYLLKVRVTPTRLVSEGGL